MNDLWLEIEALVLDGVPLNPAQGRRMAQLTEIALARLLQQRGAGTSSVGAGGERKDAGPAKMHTLSSLNEARMAEELAMILYRAVDRKL